MEFFAAALDRRREATLHPDGIHSWLSNPTHQEHLLSMCPSIKNVRPRSGIHANAYMLDNYVVKTNVFGCFYHDGQMSWLEWCEQNQDNPLVPRLAFLALDQETERYLVVMEKLEEHAGFAPNTYMRDLDRALVQRFKEHDRGSLDFLISMNSIHTDISNDIAVIVGDMEHLDPVEDDEMYEHLADELQHLKQSLQYHQQLMALDHQITTTLKAHFNNVINKFKNAVGEGRVVDVHSYNWMVRADGSPVLIDPIN